jgi:hypothetical protein
MGLSRLENFLRSIKGTTIHVNGDSLDATDSIENRGSSIARPFKNIQRALIEVVGFSYRPGLENDLFGRTTIIVHPSQYDIDNRPGILVKDDGSMFFRNGLSATLSEWSLTTNFNVYDPENELYKLNSVRGGVILPRGVSIIAYDLRKTIIRPLYVPNPENSSIENSSVFRLTGAGLPEGFTYFDANPNGFCYKDYTSNQFAPNFSHHKLHCWIYADGVNDVVINDDFLNVTTTRTDLEMYYEKVAKVYGNSSGRAITDPIYSTGVAIDLEPIIDEIRIVGSRGKEVGITSIRAGNGVVGSTTITVTLEEQLNELSVDTPIQINGVGVAGYDGQYVVYAVNSPTELQYKSTIIPTNPLPSTVGSTLNIVVDTVTSASPYIKKSTLRSVYGMCGYHADGSLVEGFKSSVISEFTGVSVQKDDNAFVKYDPVSGTYKDSTSIVNLHKDSRARYKPEYEHYHTKLSNNAFAESVSSFAIGFAKQYVVESGGDITINASKSDFGAKAFIADGFRKEAFPKDDVGYIVGVIPPTHLSTNSFNVEFYSLDVALTAASDGSKLYIADETDNELPPSYVIDGYRIGAKLNEVISLELSNGTTIGIHTASVLIPGAASSYEKSYQVQRINGNTENSVSNNVITLTTSHSLTTGEKIRITSNDGRLPDGVIPHKVVYAITTGLPSDKLKIAETFNKALSNNEITLNRNGGTLTVSSRVSDKIPGEFGHPIQWDSVSENWYITANVGNSIYTQIASLGTAELGSSTPRVYISRVTDSRGGDEKIIKFRYVIPSSTSIPARPPLDGYVIQESNNSNLNVNELPKYFSDSVTTLVTEDELRNPHYIADVKWSAGYATIYTETQHNLIAGSKIETVNVIEGEYVVYDVINSNKFRVELLTNPGVFNLDTTTRNQDLPYFKRLETATTYQIYKVQEIQEYIYNKQNGIYDLIIINNSNSPTVAPFTDLKFSQPLENLYPQQDRDNVTINPIASKCFALPDTIGEVVLNDERNSITRETYHKFADDYAIGFAISSIVSNPTGLAHTFTTTKPHNFAGVTNVSITNSGSNYEPGTYYGAALISSSGIGTNATARIIINGSGVLSSIKIMDNGCAYGIGNTATIIPAAGFGTTTGFTPAIVTITNIVDSIDDTLYIANSDVPFRITGISSRDQIQVASATTSINNTPDLVIPASKANPITSVSYNQTTGILVISFTQRHGFLVNEKIRLAGFDNPFLNKEVIVTRVVNTLVINVFVGINGGTTITGTRYAYPTITSNSNKVVYHYAGISSTTGAQLNANSLSDVLRINNATTLGLNIGDYLKVDDEIFRIKSDVSSVDVSVLRSQFGTPKQTHPGASVVKKIKIVPVELRRNSIIRASSHTLESVGYGPGNYSTALPERQDRRLTNKERNLAHAFRTNGGIVYYSANDENGDIYSTNKKTYSSTGREEVYDTPINSIVGEQKNYELLSTSAAVFNNSIKILGGDGSTISEFDGPLVINNKLTSYSEKGIEATHFLIQGNENTSRKIGIGTTVPTIPGGYGDVIFNSTPKSGQYMGWTYTLNNEWKGFGTIQS